MWHLHEIPAAGNEYRRIVRGSSGGGGYHLLTGRPEMGGTVYGCILAKTDYTCAGGEYGFECGPFESGRGTGFAVSSQAGLFAFCPVGSEGALSSFDGSKPTKTYSLGASASWELDFFGKLTNAKRRERAALEQSEAYRQVVQTQLIATVAESYYTLLMLDEQVAVTTETVESWIEYIRSLKALMRAGQADRATVNQAEASRLDAEASLLDLKQQVTETENTLCALLLWTPQPIARGTLGEVDFPESLSVGVPLNLLANRPDVWQAEAVLKQAFMPPIRHVPVFIRA